MLVSPYLLWRWAAFAPSPIKAEKTLPPSCFHCDLCSEVDPKAEIQWVYDTTKAGFWKGRLSYGGKTMFQLMATQAQGYGTRSWWLAVHEREGAHCFLFRIISPL